MNNWKEIFCSYLNSGIYNTGVVRKNSVIKKAAALNGLHYTTIDTKYVIGKAVFLQAIARGLDCPDYFGMNWDALSDCLTDMSWKPAPGYVIVFTNFKTVRANMAAEMEIIEHIFASSLQYWKERETGFYIILSG
jgi:RNAse (barnase) inhibitor barstar